MTEIDYGRLDQLEAALGGRAAIEAAYQARTPLLGGGSPVVLDPAILPVGVTQASTSLGYVDLGGVLVFFGRLMVDVSSDPGQGNAVILPLALTFVDNGRPFPGQWGSAGNAATPSNLVFWVAGSVAGGAGLWANAQVDGEVQLHDVVLYGSSP